MTTTERRTYLNHINRLKIENQILRAVVVEERLRRQAAFGWYVKRLNSKLFWLFDAMLYLHRDKK